jgi:hypothetical protein
MSIGSQIMGFIDDPAVAQWSELDAMRRCEIMSRGKEGLLKMALIVVRDDSEQQVAALAKRLGAGFASPRRIVVEMFGPGGGMKYDALAATDQKFQMYKAALLMQMCWLAAFLAM